MLKPLIIGIAGGSGSGKSTVATNVADLLTTASVAFIDMDAYYKNFPGLTLEERKRLNWDHPDAFDYDLLCEHLEAVSRGDLHDLLINVPPGTTKSLAVGVFWPAWEWTWQPWTRWLTTSYDEIGRAHV